MPTSYCAAKGKYSRAFWKEMLGLLAFYHHSLSVTATKSSAILINLNEELHLKKAKSLFFVVKSDFFKIMSNSSNLKEDLWIF